MKDPAVLCRPDVTRNKVVAARDDHRSRQESCESCAILAIALWVFVGGATFLSGYVFDHAALLYGFTALVMLVLAICLMVELHSSWYVRRCTGWLDDYELLIII